MKIKSEFVTNSSSTSYILSFSDKEYADFQKFLEIMSNGVYVIEEPTEQHIKEWFNDDQETIDDFRCEVNTDKIVIFVDVSDELGHGLIECTKFNKNIALRSGDY